MKKEFLDRLCCPMCKGDLVLMDDEWVEGEIVSGVLRCDRCELNYPIRDGIVSLLPPELRADKSEAT